MPDQFTSSEERAEILEALEAMRIKRFQDTRWRLIHKARTAQPRLKWEEIGEALGMKAQAARRIYAQQKPE